MVAAMTAIFLWMSTAFNSCGTKSDDLLNEPLETSQDFSDDDFLDDDFFEDDSDDFFSDDSEEEDVVIDDDEEEYEEVDFTEPVAPSKPKPKVTSKPRKSSASTPASKPVYSTSGDYLIIAGNYLVKTNADIMIKKLKNMGYPDAEIGVFDDSQYHTVIAARLDSYSSDTDFWRGILRC